MTKTITNSTLPHILIEAVKENRAVLIFGAGASKECKNDLGQIPPDSSQMRDVLAKKYLGTKDEDRNLMTVAEMAITNGHGEPQVFDEIAKMLSGFTPSEAHLSVTQFAWKGLATTNYDTLIESAYNKSKSSIQSCVRFTKDLEPFDDRLAEQTNSVPYLKLHGCLEHRLDPDVPLVLSNEHYNRVKTNRTQLFQRLRQWAETSVLIFIGYKLADSHIRNLIYEIDPSKRPQWFIITPSADDNDVKFWATKSIELIQTSFGEFMNELNNIIPEATRLLSSRVNSDNLPYQKHFRTESSGSDALRSCFNTEVSYVHSGIQFAELNAENFYAGFDQGWCGIIRKYDFVRKASERMLYAALDLASDDLTPRFYLLQGSAGAGKTVALKRAAYDASVSLDEMVFWVEEGATIRSEIFEELFDLTGKRAVIFVDQISLRSDAVHGLMQRSKTRGFPITIIAAEREADWYTYCRALEEEYTPEIFKLGRLSKSEAESLVELLQRHNCLGSLNSKNNTEQVASFMDSDRADRQLLVALHELTKGKPFEEIISDEFHQISPDSARRLYLDISTMHQFGVTARAGVISRISGIRFEDFENQFFYPLIDIVRVIEDRYTGDKGYTTRHPSVAKLVFGVACQDDSKTSAQLARIISGLDAGFSSDRRIIESICKGRQIAEQFSRIENAREIFEMACEASPSSAFLYQQAAILEYTHAQGALDKAHELALEARRIDNNNHIYIHTLAEVARRNANATTTRQLKESYRSRSRGYLNEISVSDSRKDLTFCKLLIDEVFDDLAMLTESALDHQVVEFDTKVGDAVSRLERAKNDNPQVSEFLAAEATLWQRLGEGQKALKSLEKASQIQPRNASVFTRLANITKKVKTPDEALKVLQMGLEKFPKDKSLHQQFALELLVQNSEDLPKIEFHLKSSFSIGDHNYDGRFFLAEFYFLTGKIEDCVKLFSEIDSKASSAFRTHASKEIDPITSKIERRTGRVERRLERIFFIRIPDYPSLVLANITSLVDFNYDELTNGMEVTFEVKFNRKGPVATCICIL